MKELKGLTLAQNKRLHVGIERGYLDDYESDPRAWKHSFVGAFLWKYPDRTKILDTFKDVLGYIPTWDDVTNDTLRDVIDELFEGGMAASSVRTIGSEIKALLNENKGRVPSDEFSKILSVKGSVSKSVYLTREEMERFLTFVPRTHIEDFVHRNFSVSMLMGARLVDAQKLTTSNCDMDTGMLSYVPKKTPGIVVTVPVDERHNLRQLLARSCGRSCHRDTYNELARGICRYLGMDTECSVVKGGETLTGPKWMFVSSHTARRSFATNLYLAGVSIEDIGMMMGHGKNIETTKRYICAERQLTPSVMSYFQPETESYGFV